VGRDDERAAHRLTEPFEPEVRGEYRVAAALCALVAVRSIPGDLEEACGTDALRCERDVQGGGEAFGIHASMESGKM
jgi:hypothetical protein